MHTTVAKQLTLHLRRVHRPASIIVAEAPLVAAKEPRRDTAKACKRDQEALRVLRELVDGVDARR